MQSDCQRQVLTYFFFLDVSSGDIYLSFFQNDILPTMHITLNLNFPAWEKMLATVTELIDCKNIDILAWQSFYATQIQILPQRNILFKNFWTKIMVYQWFAHLFDQQSFQQGSHTIITHEKFCWETPLDNKDKNNKVTIF